MQLPLLLATPGLNRVANQPSIIGPPTEEPVPYVNYSAGPFPVDENTLGRWIFKGGGAGVTVADDSQYKQDGEFIGDGLTWGAEVPASWSTEE